MREEECKHLEHNMRRNTREQQEKVEHERRKGRIMDEWN